MLNRICGLKLGGGALDAAVFDFPSLRAGERPVRLVSRHLRTYPNPVPNPGAGPI
jgi:hypothetical protein